MKRSILTVATLLFFAATVSLYARQEKGHGGQQQGSRPQQQSRPAQQPRAAQQQARSAPQARTRPQQQQQQSRPAQRQQTQNPRPAPQQHAQQGNRGPQGNATRTQARAPQSRPNNGPSGHGRISNDHYSASFGSGHSFHVNRGDYDHRRFQYGGYSFGFVDPWPVAWGYSDDVYVVYADGGYYMYDRIHPGLRISINLF